MPRALEVVVAVDQGSSSSRALAFDPKGRVLARAQLPIRAFTPKPGWVEHDALDIARTVEAVLDAVLDELPAKSLVVGAGLAAQRSTVVLWDSASGRPAAGAPSWMDGRASAVLESLQSQPELQREVHEKTGLYLTPYYSAPKIQHLLQHEPKARALAEAGRLRVGPVSTYLLWRLSKGEVFRVDPAMAQRMMLYDIRKGDFDERLMALFGVERESLPEPAPTAGLWLQMRRRGRSFPLLAVMGDQQSAALGQGGCEAGIGVLNYGTGAFFLLHTGEALHHIPGLLSSVAWQRRGRPCDYFLEGTVHAAGTSFKWLKNNFGLLKDVRGVDSACRRSGHRLFALQAIGGLGAPRWDYQTPSVLLGMRSKTRSEDVVRAVTESIALLMSDIVAAARRSRLDIRELRASGGLARIDYLLQFQADLLQKPIARLRQSEATALGVASLAAEEADMDWAARLRSGSSDRTFSPVMEAGKAEALVQGWGRFVSAQQELCASLRGMGILD
jgi:glycerol kinase